MPLWMGSPAVGANRSLTMNGTPRKGPSGISPAACARALSNKGWMTALSSGLSFSMRVIAPSTNSAGVTWPVRTSSACAVASSHAMSSLMRRSLGLELDHHAERILEQRLAGLGRVDLERGVGLVGGVERDPQVAVLTATRQAAHVSRVGAIEGDGDAQDAGQLPYHLLVTRGEPGELLVVRLGGALAVVARVCAMSSTS